MEVQSLDYARSLQTAFRRFNSPVPLPRSCQQALLIAVLLGLCLDSYHVVVTRRHAVSSCHVVTPRYRFHQSTWTSSDHSCWRFSNPCRSLSVPHGIGSANMMARPLAFALFLCGINVSSSITAPEKNRITLRDANVPCWEAISLSVIFPHCFSSWVRLARTCPSVTKAGGGYRCRGILKLQIQGDVERPFLIPMMESEIGWCGGIGVFRIFHREYNAARGKSAVV